MIGIGLLYWQGSYHQRLDPSGWQHDYWTETDQSFLSLALVTKEDGEPLTIPVQVLRLTTTGACAFVVDDISF